MKKFSIYNWLLFLVPSIIGIFLFMIPFNFQNEWKIPIAILANMVAGLVEPIMPWIVTIVLIIAALGSIIYQFIKASDSEGQTFIERLFKVHMFWTIVRIIGAVFAVMVVANIGPEAVRSEDTGGLLLSPTGLLSFLFTIFLFAGLLLPLLLNFGLLDFFGTMMIKVMRPLFKLPGRSSIDALASWVGDGTIGVLLTSKQYEEGYYTKKEAAIIGTTFSVVSITFSIVVLEELNLGGYFIPFYATVAGTGTVLALIMPRIFPLSRKADEYIDGRPYDEQAEKMPEEYNLVSHGLENALSTANKNRSIKNFFTDGLKNVLDMWIGVAPVVMAFGTIALMLATFTDLFVWLGKPFEPLLMVLGVPEATEAAQTMVVGFADMFLPAILGGQIIESEMTRFVIAATSVTQLIYMSEVGGLLLGSKIPVNILDLLLIFLLRTVLALPIIVGVAHLLF
ncbi:YjiH family protein [Paenisporosarcina sp. TG20]|uniref:YjiH family protein n=1 Tax=Paenisporosarcina sp. TG20 TaxID=1211706 RepID=UPI0002E51BC2|nr:YjiH family protein [Paenisporosarcina sp. TG20]